MFNAVKVFLRNALLIAKSQMHLSEETFRMFIALIDLLSDKTYILLGLGEDVVGFTPEVVYNGVTYTVPLTSATPGTVTFAKVTYAHDLLLQEVVLAGTGLDFVVQKSYPDKTVAAFNGPQLPLLSDNFSLVVTIQPGGSLGRAVLLQQVVV